MVAVITTLYVYWNFRNDNFGEQRLEPASESRDQEEVSNTPDESQEIMTTEVPDFSEASISHVPPTCTLTVTPSDIFYSDTVKLMWETANATTSRWLGQGIEAGVPSIDPGLQGSLEFAPKIDGEPSSFNHSIVLTVGGPGGEGVCITTLRIRTSNGQRQEDVKLILNAIYQQQIENNSLTVPGLDADEGTVQILGTATSGCGGVCPAAKSVTSCFDLKTFVSTKYLSTVPKDPVSGTDAITNYYVNRENSGRNVVGACDPVGDMKINLRR